MQGGRALGELMPRPTRRGFRRLLPAAGLPEPNLWWPADRAWRVASDIDLPSTYLGGTRARR